MVDGVLVGGMLIDWDRLYVSWGSPGTSCDVTGRLYESGQSFENIYFKIILHSIKVAILTSNTVQKH